MVVGGVIVFTIRVLYNVGVPKDIPRKHTNPLEISKIRLVMCLGAGLNQTFCMVGFANTAGLYTYLHFLSDNCCRR